MENLRGISKEIVNDYMMDVFNEHVAHISLNYIDEWIEVALDRYLDKEYLSVESQCKVSEYIYENLVIEMRLE